MLSLATYTHVVPLALFHPAFDCALVLVVNVDYVGYSSRARSFVFVSTALVKGPPPYGKLPSIASLSSTMSLVRNAPMLSMRTSWSSLSNHVPLWTGGHHIAFVGTRVIATLVSAAEEKIDPVIFYRFTFAQTKFVFLLCRVVLAVRSCR